MADQLDKKGIVKALVFALLIAFVGIGILAWQYRQIEGEQIPALEEKIEKNEAQDALEEFLAARLGQDEAKTTRYLTEGAIEQKAQQEFVSIANYEILGYERLGENRYRFAVKVEELDSSVDLVEVIILVKILDSYYVDSVRIAG